jgi:hypothetical protein
MRTQWEIVYYTTSTGKCPVERFLESRSIRNQARLLAWLVCLAERGPQYSPSAHNLGDGIYEYRIRLGGKQTRRLYFFCDGRSLILTHGIVKTPTKDIVAEVKKVKKYRDDFGRDNTSGPLRTLRQHLEKKLQHPEFAVWYKKAQDMPTIS